MSDEPFNRLTPGGAEALALLAEECAETIAIIGKILRHGMHSRHPDTTECNSDLLIYELGDVRAAESIVMSIFGLADGNIDAAKRSKLSRVKKYLHHVALP